MRRQRYFFSRSSVDDCEKKDVYSLLSDALTRRIFMADDPEVTRLEILNRRIMDDLDLRISKTTIKPSPIAGRGLFATVDCKPGEILTCYPGDGIIRTPDPENEKSWSIQWGDHVIAPEDRSRTMKDLSITMRGYILYMDDGHSIIGLPRYDDDTSYLGHFANDGAKYPTCSTEIEAYVEESNATCNARHQGISGDCHMVTMSTRHIKAGDEIFVTYGAEYWIQQTSYNVDG